MPSFPSSKPTVSYFNDLDFFKDFENEFPAIIYNDALMSKLDFLTEPIVSPQDIDGFNLRDKTSLSKCDKEEQNILYFNDPFPFNVIYLDDSNSNKDNDEDKMRLSTLSGDNVINTDDGTYAQRSNKLLKTSYDTSNKFFKTRTFIKELNLNIIALAIMSYKRMTFIFLIKNYLFCKSFSSTTMGDANPIRTLGDYSRPSHEGYRNTIELPEENNVVPLRFDTIRLVQNGCLFHGLRSKDPNQHLKDFLKLVDSLDLDVANRERTHLRLFQFFLRDQARNWLERLPAGSISTWEDLTTRSLAQLFPPRRTAKLRNDILVGFYDLINN
ncbi:zinc finger, CCHC-type containing protein [Tanacetum coccineum]